MRDITQNLIAGNSSSNGGGIYWLVFRRWWIRFRHETTIVDNSAVQKGSAIYEKVQVGQAGQEQRHHWKNRTIGNLLRDRQRQQSNGFRIQQRIFRTGFSLQWIFVRIRQARMEIFQVAPLFVDRAAPESRATARFTGYRCGNNSVVGFQSIWIPFRNPPSGKPSIWERTNSQRRPIAHPSTASHVCRSERGHRQRTQ
jgi:hypothetical protein